MKDQLYRSIWRRKMAKWQLFKYHPKQRVCMDWVDRPQNCKGLYGILQLLQGSHLDNFPQKTLKLGLVGFHSLKVQLKCLYFQSNEYRKLAPLLSRFCNGLCVLLSFFQRKQNPVCFLFLLSIFSSFNFFLFLNTLSFPIFHLSLLQFSL